MNTLLPAAPAGTAEATPAALPSAGSRFDFFRLPGGSLELAAVAEKPHEEYRVVDASGAPLAVLKVSAGRVKVRSASGVERYKVKEDGFEVEDTTGRRLFRAKERDGGWRLTDGSDSPGGGPRRGLPRDRWERAVPGADEGEERRGVVYQPDGFGEGHAPGVHQRPGGRPHPPRWQHPRLRRGSRPGEVPPVRRRDAPKPRPSQG